MATNANRSQGYTGYSSQADLQQAVFEQHVAQQRAAEAFARQAAVEAALRQRHGVIDLHRRADGVWA